MASLRNILPLAIGAIGATGLALAACAGPSAQGPSPVDPDPAQSGSPQQGTAPDTGTATSTQPKPAPYNAVPLIPQEVLFGNPTNTRPRVSPDGKRLAYLAPDEGVLNVWVRTVGKDDAKPVTRDRKRGIRQHFWAPNSKQIVYLQDKDGDENWHVYAVSADGGEAMDLTPIENVNAQVVAVEPKQPNTILVGLNDRDPQLHDVYAIDLKTGKRTLAQKNDIGAIAWIVDHDLKVRAAQAFLPDGGSKVLYRATPKAPWKDIITWKAEDAFTSGVAGFAGDNQTLYVLSSAETNAAVLHTVDARTGAAKALAADATWDVSELLVHPTTHAVQAVGFNKARLEWKAIDPAIEGDLTVLASLHKGDFRVDSRDNADKIWIVSYEQDTGPVKYFVYDRTSKTGTFLFSHRPELEGLPLAEMKPVTYQARDGLTIHGYLTTPVGVEAKKLPTVINPHGGPWARDMWGFDPLSQMLANRGYAVLQPNFRGSTGYGKQFLNAADREWGGKMQDDITDGTRWLIDQGIADPARICIMGGSYGGYATLMGLVREPELYACGVNIVGVANLITWMKTIPPYWIPLRHVLYQRVGNPETEAKFLESRSPVFLADRIKAPLLIAQGANDPRVPRDESIQIRDALQKAGKEVQYVEYPDEGHGFARPENRLAFFKLAEKFLADKIGGRTEE